VFGGKRDWVLCYTFGGREKRGEPKGTPEKKKMKIGLVYCKRQERRRTAYSAIFSKRNEGV